MAEVADADLTVLQNAKALLEKLNNDPRTKAQLEAAIKVHHPEVVTEQEQAERIAAPLLAKVEETAKSLQDRLDKLDADDKARADAHTEAQIGDAFGRLKQAGYTDEGIEKIKGLMVDRNIADPEAAAAYFDRLNPPVQEQPSWSPPSWDLSQTADKGADMAALFKDEDKWADNKAAEVLNEIRVGQKN